MKYKFQQQKIEIHAAGILNSCSTNFLFVQQKLLTLIISELQNIDAK